MKKIICGALSVMVLLLVSGWSGEISNADTGEQDLYYSYPVLCLRYNVDGEYCFEQAKNYPQTWTAYVGDGLVMTAHTCYATEIPIANDLPNIELISNETDVKLLFTLQPSSYSVKRFDNSSDESYPDSGGVKVEVTDNTITLEDDGNQYLYRVIAQWDGHGSVIYWFSAN